MQNYIIFSLLKVKEMVLGAYLVLKSQVKEKLKKSS